jgi:hypothetical protein
MQFAGAAMRSFAILILLAGLVSAAPRQDNSTSALINEALDKNVNIQLDGVLPDVLKTITAKTGVRIEPTDEVYDLLPWGEETKITAKIEGQTLRAALTAISHKLGLGWELGQFEVRLKPMPALARLGRRATVKELQALDLLTSTPLAQHKDQMTVEALVKLVDQQLAAIKSPALSVDLRPGDPTDPRAGLIKLDQPINVRRNATISEALQDLSRQSDATWYPWGKDIVVVPKQQQIRLQLDKTVSARFNGVDVSAVLDKLAALSGVPFDIEAGAIQRVPPEYRSIKLDLENATIRRALDDIRGVTGLDYTVKPDGVSVWNKNPPSASARAAANDPVVAILETDGGLQVLLRESETPADVREYLKHKEQEQIQRLRRRMADENFIPTTGPASEPEPGAGQSQ